MIIKKINQDLYGNQLSFLTCTLMINWWEFTLSNSTFIEKKMLGLENTMLQHFKIARM